MGVGIKCANRAIKLRVRVKLVVLGVMGPNYQQPVTFIPAVCREWPSRFSVVTGAGKGDSTYY